jgi:hypothetical protein
VTDSDVNKVAHFNISFLFINKEKTPPGIPGGVNFAFTKPHLSIATPDLAPCFQQVAGFHRAVPSTTLDKVCSGEQRSEICPCSSAG